MSEIDIRIEGMTISLAGMIGCVELVCSCGTNWCDHRTVALKTREDAKLLWPRPIDKADGLGILGEIGPFGMNVPIFPLWGFFAVLDFVPQENGRYMIVWTNAPSGNDEFICYLSPGEGLQVVREIAVEHMLGDPKRKGICESFGHGVKAEHRWQQHMANKTLSVIEKWSVYTTGWCLLCRGASENIGDLIPERNGSIFNG